MDYIILSSIGLIMGFFGGLLGIGGSAIMIPALVLVYAGPENQHLFQASAMICNFCVAASSALAHKKARSLHKPVLKQMVPMALIGIVVGVAWSNSAMFSQGNGYVLSRTFGGFLAYVAIYNTYRLVRSLRKSMPDERTVSGINETPWLVRLIGLVTGLAAGLLGIGAGTLATPLQQLFLRVPLRRAMSNSSVTIMCIAWLGAIYKNGTLNRHNVSFALFANDSPLWISIKISAIIAPTAILGGFLGGYMMHKLPKNVVRSVFIVILVVAALRLLTVKS
jgi:uncharacterized membrane protein YfcA